MKSAAFYIWQAVLNGDRKKREAKGMTTNTAKAREGFTTEQYASLARKWAEANQGMSLDQFVESASGPHFGDYIMVNWCGMTLGIEADGYCHS